MEKKGHEGFLLIDKPVGPSSFAVVAAVRRALTIKKTGHAGTLDPAASGLLVLAVGSATRLLPYLPLEPKSYRVSVRFGTETDTLDRDGAVVKSGGRIPEQYEIEAALPSFTGSIEQVPPGFSAIKINGVRSYHRARKGEKVELAARTVEIHSLRLLRCEAGEAELEVICSGGTYVRSLARDIAGTLGTCGYASAIRRTKIGHFDVEKALGFEQIGNQEISLIGSGEALSGQPQIVLNNAQTARLATGGDIVLEQTGVAQSPATVFAFDQAGRIAAVLARVEGSRYHPEKVFICTENKSPDGGKSGS